MNMNHQRNTLIARLEDHMLRVAKQADNCSANVATRQLVFSERADRFEQHHAESVRSRRDRVRRETYED